MKKITMYEWGAREIKRIEITTQEDTAKIPEIPLTGLFGKVHQKYLDSKRKKHHERQRG